MSTASVVVLSRADVHRLLPMAECIDAMETALGALARGDAVLPLRQAVWTPERTGLLGVMPAYLGEPRCMGLKAVTVMPGNHAQGLPSHRGAVLLFDAVHGALLAVMDAGAVTEIRTAAVSGLATRLLAREDAGDLAILGSGVQAGSHLEAMRAVRRLRRVRVWSRTREHAHAFAAREAARLGFAIEAMGSAREAVLGAEVVCTVTAAREPVLAGEWLSPGAHVNAVGACFAGSRELDAHAVARARLIVDRRESAMSESGDVLLAIAEGAIDDAHVRGELGDVLLGRVPGRTSPEEVTLFESLGVAVEDLAAAHAVHARALESGTGLRVEMT